MLTVLRVHLPSDIPIVGCELTPYVLLRRPDKTVTTDDVPESAPLDGHFLRYKWLVFNLIFTSFLCSYLCSSFLCFLEFRGVFLTIFYCCVGCSASLLKFNFLDRLIFSGFLFFLDVGFVLC